MVPAHGSDESDPLSLLSIHLYRLCVPSRAAAGENATLWYQRVTTKSRALAKPWFSMPYSSADIQLGQIKFGGVDPTLYIGSRPRVAIRVALLALTIGLC